MPTHHERRLLPYSARQMYDLVADVAAYPEFLPWTAAARIRSRTPIEDEPGAEIMEADLVISFKVFRERFGSRVTLRPESRVIDTEYIDGPFRHMRSRWSFAEVPEADGGGCEIEFFVDFEFRNAILRRLIGLVFNEAMQRVVRAFEKRAAQLHGSGSSATG